MRGALFALGAGAITLSLLACNRTAPISSEYDEELSALASEGGEGLPYLAGKDMRPIWKNGDSAPAPRELLPFKLKDQLGHEIDTDSLKGKVTIVSFFFSKCPGICPTTTRNLKAVQEKFKNDDRVTMLSLSITPEADTPEVLAQYAKANKIDAKRWHLLTGAREEIYALARDSFNADTFSAKENSREKISKKDFLHSENVYLIDGERKLRGVYAGARPDSLRELTEDAGVLLR